MLSLTITVTNLLNEGFYHHLVDEGMIEDDLGLQEPDDEEEDD